MRILNRAILALASICLLGGTTAVAQTPSEPRSSVEMVWPYIIDGWNQGGNRNCAEVGEAFWDDPARYDCYAEKQNYSDGFVAFEDVSGNPDCDLQTVTVAVTQDTFVEFWAEPYGIGAAIIKGGNAANVYVYDLYQGDDPGPERLAAQSTHDSGLASPIGSSGGPAGLSNIGGFCWNITPPDDPPPDECWGDETAWSSGAPYNNRRKARGNWALYTEYSNGLTADLIAGQHFDAGDVLFTDIGDGLVEIEITLAEDWRFAQNIVGEDDGDPIFDDNVKVQGYGDAPSGNPKPGQFDDKEWFDADENPATIVVPLADFYGVHVDVEFLTDCQD